jgi:hypothetical protein
MPGGVVREAGVVDALRAEDACEGGQADDAVARGAASPPGARHPEEGAGGECHAEPDEGSEQRAHAAALDLRIAVVADDEIGLGEQARDGGCGQAGVTGHPGACGERGDAPDRSGVGDLIPGPGSQPRGRRCARAARRPSPDVSLRRGRALSFFNVVTDRVRVSVSATHEAPCR